MAIGGKGKTESPQSDELGQTKIHHGAVGGKCGGTMEPVWKERADTVS